MLFMTYCTYIDLRENCMLQVNNTNQIQYHMGFTSNPVKNSAEEGVKISEQDKVKKTCCNLLDWNNSFSICYNAWSFRA